MHLQECNSCKKFICCFTSICFLHLRGLRCVWKQFLQTRIQSWSMSQNLWFQFHFKSSLSLEPRKKNLLTVHYTGCLIGILTAVNYHPPKTGLFFIANKSPKQPRIFIHCSKIVPRCHWTSTPWAFGIEIGEETAPRLEPVRRETASQSGKPGILPSLCPLHHLESRWRNPHVLVYHGLLLIHLLGVAPSTFTTV